MPMSHILPLISTIEEVRAAFIAEASGLSVPQTQFQPTPDSWSILQVVEHIYWAEQVGVLGMWKAAHAASLGIPLWEGENPNLGFSIEEVIANTWQVKEKVPEVAKPRMGGPIDFWLVSLTANQKILSTLGDYLEGMDVESIIYPHPISGTSECHPTIGIS